MRRKNTLPRVMFERKTGIELRIGDSVAKYFTDDDDWSGRVEVEGVLVEVMGKCDRGIHFKSDTGNVGCFDYAGYTLVLR